jgi:hypothetical protein
MASLQFDFECSRTDVYAPLQNQIGASPLGVSYYFKDSFCCINLG